MPIVVAERDPSVKLPRGKDVKKVYKTGEPSILAKALGLHIGAVVEPKDRVYKPGRLGRFRKPLSVTPRPEVIGHLQLRLSGEKTDSIVKLTATPDNVPNDSAIDMPRRLQVLAAEKPGPKKSEVVKARPRFRPWKVEIGLIGKTDTLVLRDGQIIGETAIRGVLYDKKKTLLERKVNPWVARRQVNGEKVRDDEVSIRSNMVRDDILRIFRRQHRMTPQKPIPVKDKRLNGIVGDIKITEETLHENGKYKRLHLTGDLHQRFQGQDIPVVGTHTVEVRRAGRTVKGYRRVLRDAKKAVLAEMNAALVAARANRPPQGSKK